jgi:hypothetical protein
VSCVNSTQHANRARNEEEPAPAAPHLTYNLCMTARDELRRLVDELPEDRVSVALVEVQRLVGTSDTHVWPPPWFGAVKSGRTDTSERIDELLADGFGR